MPRSKCQPIVNYTHPLVAIVERVSLLHEQIGERGEENK